MNDEWLKQTIHECKNLPSIDFIRVNRVELLNRLQHLEWYAQHAARRNEAARQLRKSKEVINE